MVGVGISFVVVISAVVVCIPLVVVAGGSVVLVEGSFVVVIGASVVVLAAVVVVSMAVVVDSAVVITVVAGEVVTTSVGGAGVVAGPTVGGVTSVSPEWTGRARYSGQFAGAMPTWLVRMSKIIS
mmetsp:Transcript_24271/g.68880  ORF Transcript_24271/g.68880 Transcript_24271/m.68880 type:complete len:125 (+) Transcript_24271:1009-1383(+)